MLSAKMRHTQDSSRVKCILGLGINDDKIEMEYFAKVGYGEVEFALQRPILLLRGLASDRLD